MAASLGTLTLDLIAKIGAFTGPLDSAKNKAKSNTAEISKSFENLKKGVVGSLAAVPAALTALVVSSANTAKEISNQAALAGLGTTEFQKYAAGARSVGVEQDKLSDIFKDVNDKVGDFLNTGGGQLKDFFTNIAPKVGVTADQFRKLNSKDALSLYVTSLEKANVSQKEMTFYMESIANDSTALVPLLRDNGKAFNEMGAAAEATGVILDENTIAAAKQFGIELQGLEQYLTSAKTMVAAEFLPVLAQFTKDLNTSATEAGGLKGKVGDLGEALVTAAAFVVNAGDGVVRVFDIVSNTLVGLYSTAVGRLSSLMSSLATGLSKVTIGETADNFKADAERLAGEAQTNFGIAAEAAAQLKKNIEEPLAGDKFKEYVENAKKNAAELAKTQSTLTKGTGSGVDPAAIAAQAAAAKKAASDAAAAAKKIQDSFAGAETDLQRQIELINTSVDARKNATEVEKLQFEIQSGKLKGINAQQETRLEQLATELDRLEKLKKANEDAAKAATFKATLDDTNATTKAGFDSELAGAGMGDKLKDRLKQDLAIQQDYNNQVADLQKQLNGGDITQELYDQETQMLSDALAERMILQQDYYNQLDEQQANWLDGVSSAWENYKDTATDYQQQAADATSGTLGDVTSSIAENIDGVLKKQEDLGDAAKNVVVDLASSVVSALEKMAAQWLVYQAVQLFTTKATQASAVPALVANAEATALQASLAAFASTAAIPIVGPLAAPAAAAAAASFAQPLVAGISTAALAGMAHDGIDSVPETGTWLLQQGERVTTAQTSAKLDATLDNIRNNPNNSGGGVNVNLIEDASKAGRSQMREQDGERFLDLFISDLYADGKTKDAMSNKFGLTSRGS